MLAKISLSQIAPNPDQPRKVFDAGALNELAQSIKARGLLQPITVRPIGKDSYQIVAGERRWRAYKLLAETQGLDAFGAILCHVKRMSDADRDLAAIIENLQRVDVTPMEEAHAFQRLKAGGMTEEAIASAVGSPVFRVRWRLQLLNLAPEIRKLFESEAIDRQSAMEIGRLPDHAQQVRMVQLVNRGQLRGWKSVRTAVETMIAGTTQADIFGGADESADADVAVVSRMEAKIASVAAMVATGWREGECVIATRVNPDRATKMAEQIAAISKALRVMERELRNSAAQGQAVLAA
jgi:ParB family transcriptional regulator, chromosome partitioning protein